MITDNSPPSSPSLRRFHLASAQEILEVLGQLEEREVLEVLCKVLSKTDEDMGTLLFTNAKRRGRDSILLQTILSIEVDRTSNPELLFREESLCTKVVKAALSNPGTQFIHTVLHPITTKFIEQGQNAEVDPSKLKAGISEKELRTQRARLEKFTDKILEAVYNSLPQFSPEMIYLFKLIRDVVSTKFPDSGHHAVGSFLFLRFICVYLTQMSLALPSQRTFLLAAKIIQNLANDVKFEKEVYMIPFNEFVKKHKERLTTFYTKLLTKPIIKSVQQNDITPKNKYDILQDYIPLSDFIQSHFFKLRRETKTVCYGAAVMGVFNQLSTLGKMAKGINDLSVRNTPTPLYHSQSDPIVIQSTQIYVAPLTRSVSSMPSSSDSIEEDTGSDSATTLLQMDKATVQKMTADGLKDIFLNQPVVSERYISPDGISVITKRNITGSDLLAARSHQELASLGFNFKDRQLLLRFLSETL